MLDTIKITNNMFTNIKKVRNYEPVQQLLGKKLEEVFKTNTMSEQQQNEITNLFRQALPHISTQENFVSMGFYNKIYKLNDNLLVKIPRDYPLSKISKNAKFELANSSLPKLERYAANALGIFDGRIKVMHDVGEHLQAGIPNKLDKMLTYEETDAYYKNYYLKIFSQVPQESYDLIAKDCKTLNETLIDGESVTYDFINPNNIIKADDKLWFVDSLDFNDEGKKATSQNLITMLLSKYTFEDKCENYTDTKTDVLTMLKKILSASVKEHLPIIDKTSSLDPLPTIFRDLKIKLDPFNFIENIIEISKKRIPLAEKLEEISKFIDSLSK